MKKDMYYVVEGGWMGYNYKELCEVINRGDYIGEFETEEEALKVVEDNIEEVCYYEGSLYLVHNNTYIEKC